MEFLIGVLAAWGGIMLLWTLLGVAMLPLTRRKDTRIFVVLQAEGDAPRLEQYLKGILWLRNAGVLWWNVAVLKDDLTEDAENRMISMTEKEHCVALIGADELTDWMER